MFKFATARHDYLFLNISEVRQRLADLIERIKKYKVVVMKNGKPAMMMVDFEEYQKLQAAMDAEEDDYFAGVVKERMTSKDKKTFAHEEVVKKFKK